MIYRICVLILWFFALNISLKGYSQQGCIDSTFTYNYFIKGGNFYLGDGSGEKTKEGGLLLKGYSQSATYPDEFIKLSSSGEVNWADYLKCKDPSTLLGVSAITEMKDGSFIFAFRKDNHPGMRIGVAKLDYNGKILWERTFRNNYETASGEPIFYIGSVSEGENGDIILNTFEKGDQNYRNGPGITRLDSNGNTVWSLQYFDWLTLIDDNKNVYHDGTLTFWGRLYESAQDTALDALHAVVLNYNTGNIEKVIRYQLAPENRDMSLLIYRSPNINYNIAKRLQNGGISLFYYFSSSALNKMLYLRFDKDLNFIRALSIVQNNADSYFEIGTPEINDVDGSLIFSADEEIPGLPQPRLPYQYSIIVKDNSAVPSQFYFDGMDWHFFRFQGNSRINEIIGKNGSFTVVNLPADPVASSFCDPAKDSSFGYYKPYRLNQSEVDYQWQDIRRNVYTSYTTSEITAIPLEVNRQEDCKKIFSCDSFKLSGQSSFCFDNHSPALFTGLKNEECNRRVEWSFDTSFASVQSQVSDSSVELNFTKPGNFKLYASLQGCGLTDSMDIRVYENKSALDIAKGEGLCPGNSLTLYATKGFVSYQWNDGSTADTLVIRRPGNYFVQATDGCGHSFADSALVPLIDTAFYLPIQASVCLNDSLKITLPPSVKSIDWNPDESVTQQNDVLYFFPPRSTPYHLRANFSENCFSEKDIYITVDRCPETIFFPNSFTPNQDGLNDYFRPVLGRYLTSYRMTVFNRYGQKVFESGDPNTGWNGYFKSEPCDSGLYVWICEYQFPGRELKKIKGNLTLIK